MLNVVTAVRNLFLHELTKNLLNTYSALAAVVTTLEDMEAGLNDVADLLEMAAAEDDTDTVAAPLVTVTYCLPSRSHVIGIPVIPEPVWNCQSFLPVAASNATNSPVCAPVKTTPPAVDRTPDQNGVLESTSHRFLPVTGSHATSEPLMPSGGATKPPS